MTLSLPAQSWQQAAPAPAPAALAPAPRAAAPRAAGAAPRPTHQAELLCGADGLAHILLGEQTYTLRITRAGKLILTK